MLRADTFAMKKTSRRSRKSSRASREVNPQKTSSDQKGTVGTSSPDEHTHEPNTAKSNGDFFPIVGVGASAGGLEAFTRLIKHLSTDTGMAFVLVQHLDPEHESKLPQLLGRVTKLPVLEVVNNTRVKPNHIYVMPPNKSMTIERRTLRLMARKKRDGHYRSIDR